MVEPPSVQEMEAVLSTLFAEFELNENDIYGLIHFKSETWNKALCSILGEAFAVVFHIQPFLTDHLTHTSAE